MPLDTLTDPTGPGTDVPSLLDDGYTAELDPSTDPTTDLAIDGIDITIHIDENGIDVEWDTETTDTDPDTDESDDTDTDQSDDEMVGDPEDAEDYWFEQAVDGWCGPASAAEIIAEATGSTNLEATELEVVARAEELGLLTHDGTDITAGWSGMQPEGIETLLESFGVPAATGTGTLDDLETAIADGDRVIVSVDSGMIWNAEGDLPPQTDSGTADHALVVTGIDEENGVVYLNDPGRPEGAATHVPLDVFEQAWATGGNTMIVADVSDTVPADADVSFADLLAQEGSKILLLPVTVSHAAH